MTNEPAIVLVHGFWGGAAHWANVIVELSRRGYHDLHAVENPLTSLADDAERTRKMVAQIEGPVLLVGHSYGGAVLTEAGDLPNVAGLVYIAAFAPDAGESPGQISEATPPAAFANIAPDSDGYLWIAQDKFRESFCQDLPEDDALVMAVAQKAPLGSTFGDTVTAPAALFEITAGRTMLLDGELVAPDDRGAPSFSLLQRRMHVQRSAPALIEQVRVDYLAFDLLALDADIPLDDPYTSRRIELRLDDGARVWVPPNWSLTDHDAEQLLHTAAESGMEGIVCKEGRLDLRAGPPLLGLDESGPAPDDGGDHRRGRPPGPAPTRPPSAV